MDTTKTPAPMPTVKQDNANPRTVYNYNTSETIATFRFEGEAAQFVTAVNSHDSNVKRIQELEEALKKAKYFLDMIVNSPSESSEGIVRGANKLFDEVQSVYSKKHSTK